MAMTLKKRVLAQVCAVVVATAGLASSASLAGPSAWLKPEATGTSNKSAAHGKRGERRQVEIQKTGGRYKTLQAAIDAAGAYGVVNLEDGVYAESLVIKHPVKLTARRPSTSPDKPGKTYFATINALADKPCLTIDLVGWGKVEVENLNLVANSNSYSHGCIEVKRGDLDLKNSRVYGSRFTPAIMVNGGELNMDNSSALNGREGLFIANAPQDATFNITKSTFANNMVGIRVLARADVNLYENNIRQNASQGIVYYYGYGSITANVVCDNGGNGIEIQLGPEVPQIRDNVPCRNQGNGIVFLQNITETALPVPPMELRSFFSGNHSFGNAGAGFVDQTGRAVVQDLGPNCFEENGTDSRKLRRATRKECNRMHGIRKTSTE